MLKRWQRVILDKDATQRDVSLVAQNGTGFDFDLSGATEYLYIGQYYPFNNLYFSLSGGNSAGVTGSTSVEYWSGSAWVDAVDVVDDTDELASSGVIQWQPNKNTGWCQVADTSEETGLEITAFTLYDLYWARISIPAGFLHANTDCLFLGYKFCTHADLVKIDPEINEYLTPWGGASKTTWDEQIITASESVVAELKQRGLVVHPGQVLRFDDVYEATVYKTLMIIYSQLGESFKAKFDAAKDEYIIRMSQKRWTFDKDKDGAVSFGEITNDVAEIER